MPEYDLKIGFKTSIKNTLVAIAPALGAAYIAFLANAPEEYKPYIMVGAAFVGVFVKNWFKHK